MSNSTVNTWSIITMILVIALGLFLPFLNSLLGHLKFKYATLIKRLFLYELLLATIGLGVAFVVCVFIPGTTPELFSIGSLETTVNPIRFLGIGINANATWRNEIISLTFAITAITTIFVFLGSKDKFSWRRALRVFPIIIIFALLNATGEEWLYRVALLRSTEGAISLQYASIISATVFGVAHFRGRPGGILGILISGLLGFLLSRITIETGGIATAIIIHFIQDIIIFTGWFGTEKDTK